MGELYLSPKGSNGKLRAVGSVQYGPHGPGTAERRQASLLAFRSNIDESAYFVGINDREANPEDPFEEGESVEFYLDTADDAAKLRDFFGAIAIAMGDNAERKAQNALYSIGFADGITSERRMVSRRLKLISTETAALADEVSIPRPPLDEDGEAVRAYGLYDREQAARPDLF
jgi:hypothetical protein